MNENLSRIAVLLLTVGAAWVSNGALAQDTDMAGATSSSQSAGPAPTPKASEPYGPRRKGSPAWWGSDVTPGWSLMSWKERNEHRKHMRSLKTYDECKAYLDEHHQKMAERAKEQGKPDLLPRRDACERLKP